ncbi:MAG: hypothetical protein Pyrs2KO_20920 [Pyruvatibacter sp.]
MSLYLSFIPLVGPVELEIMLFESIYVSAPRLLCCHLSVTNGVHFDWRPELTRATTTNTQQDLPEENTKS